jgi:hypothetical protein
VPHDLLQAPLAALRRFLGRAAEQAEEWFDTSGPVENPYRGLSVSEQDVKAGLIVEGAGARCFGPPPDDFDAALGLLRIELERLCGGQPLQQFDAAVVLVALAPDLDLWFERCYAFLQDDVTRRRPTVALILQLLCRDALEQAVRRRRFLPSASLFSQRLVELAADADRPRAGLLGSAVRVDELLCHRLLGAGGVDRRLAPFARLVPRGCPLAELPLPPEVRAGLAACTARTPLRLYLHGPDPTERLGVAASLGQALSRAVLVTDLPRLLASAERDVEQSLRLVLRHGEWFELLVVLEGADALHSEERRDDWQALARRLACSPAPVVLAGTRTTLPPATTPTGIYPVYLAPPDREAREDYWAERLEGLTPALRRDEVAELADRYVLTRTQIDEAMLQARARFAWNEAARPKAPAAPRWREALEAASRAQGSHALESLTQKVHPRVTLIDVVTPPEVKEQLEDLRQRIDYRHWVRVEWGFDRKYSYGNGINALFAGPPGTGKTLAAEALAGELKVDLFKIDLSTVLSRYIGETEERLERVFQAGEVSRAVLFFDEAESLLGRRTEVKDAHDFYANQQCSFLLQRMERYDGLIILATNLPGNLDEAFLRRMTALVYFEAPDEAGRREIWRTVWPDSCILADDVKAGLSHLAKFPLTGGHIRSAATTAAYRAAARGDRDRGPRQVFLHDVLHAVRQEMRKVGRDVSDEELGLDRFAPGGVRDEAEQPEPAGEQR